jgi:sugar phosphate isomerase/epimerase
MRELADLLSALPKFFVCGSKFRVHHQLLPAKFSHGAAIMDTLSRRSFLATSALAATGTLTANAAHAAADEAAKFQLGIVTYNVPKDWDLPTLLKVCKEVGVAAVECRTTHKHGVEPTLNAEQRKEVKKQFADSGVVFWGCGSVCEFHSADPAVVKKQIEDCKQFVKLVHDIGGKGVKVRPNGVPKGADEQKTFEQIGKALQECGKAASDAGVEIWVEVHGAITQIPKNMRTIMDACGHKSVGVTWNSNAADIADKSVAAGFELLKPFIKSCHINDLNNDAKGAYPYRELFKLLRGIGYDRYTLCEVGTAYDVAKGTAFLKDYKALWQKLVAG